MSRNGLIPNVFHRRLLLLLALTGAAFGMLTLRLSVLSLSRGADLRAQAESALLRERWTPAARGKIVDRKGRILAQDRPSYDVAVPFIMMQPSWRTKDDGTPEAVPGTWARVQASSWAKKLSGQRWYDLAPTEREERIAALLPVFEAHACST